MKLPVYDHWNQMQHSSWISVNEAACKWGRSEELGGLSLRRGSWHKKSMCVRDLTLVSYLCCRWWDRGQIGKGCVTLRGRPTGAMCAGKTLSRSPTPNLNASCSCFCSAGHIDKKNESIHWGRRSAGLMRATAQRSKVSLAIWAFVSLRYPSPSLSLSCSLSLTFSQTKTLCDIKRCFAWIDHNTQPFTLSFPPPVVLLPWPIRYLSRKPAFPRPACTTAIHPFILWFLLSTNGFGTTGPYSPHASAHHHGWHAACAIIILGCICKEVVSLSCRSRNIGLSKPGVHMQIFLAESTTCVFFPSLRHSLKSATSKSCFKVYLAIIPHHKPLCPLESGCLTTKREHTKQRGRAKGKTGLSLYLFFFNPHGA